MKTASAPKAPMYMPPPAYQQATYTNPQPFQQPLMNPMMTVPQVSSPLEIMGSGASVESRLPQWLQLNNSPMSSDLLGQYGEDYYKRNIMPAIEAEKARIGLNGQQYGTPAWAMLGQMASQGQFDKFQASLGFGQQLFNNQLQGRQSYFSGGPRIAQEQNASDVNRGLGVANLLQQGANSENNYNLSTAQMANNFNLSNSQGLNNYNMNANQGMNNFGLNNYGNQMSQYNTDQQNSANRWYSGLSLGSGIAGLAGKAMGWLKGNPSATLGGTVGGALSRVGNFFGLGGGGQTASAAPSGGSNPLALAMPSMQLGYGYGNPGAIGIR